MFSRTKAILTKELKLSEIRSKKIRTKLIVSIPILITTLVVGSGIIYYKILNEILTSVHIQGPPVLVTQGIIALKRHITIMGAFSAIVAFLLAIAITWPLRKIAQGAEAVTGRDFSHYISLDTTVEEISRLGNVFNEMIFSLNEHMLESMAGGVLTINMDGLITNFNSAAELILDCNSKEAVGRHYSMIFPPCPENEKFSASIDSATKYHQAGAAQKMEIMTRGNKKIAITLSTSLLKSEVDTLLGVVVTFQDIDQMQELEEQMRYTDKLASLARLSRGIAHEIRNPLGSIKGLAQLLLESGDLDKKKKEYLEIMVKESDRLDKTVGDLLTFSEQGDLVLKPEPVRPEQISQEILSMVSPEAEIKNIQIIKEFP